MTQLHLQVLLIDADDGRHKTLSFLSLNVCAQGEMLADGRFRMIVSAQLITKLPFRSYPRSLFSVIVACHRRDLAHITCNLHRRPDCTS